MGTMHQQFCSARRQLKDFEREARADGMPAPLLLERKKALANELNALIARKKEIAAFGEREDLMQGQAVKEEDNIECASSPVAVTLPACPGHPLALGLRSDVQPAAHAKGAERDQCD